MTAVIVEKQTRRVRICNKEGLHLRAAAAFSQVALHFACDIRVTSGERHADARSIRELLGLVAESGSELILEANGVQSQEALAHLSALVDKQFRRSAAEDCREGILS
jgi:phosphotransferase system HPr (HPr) family protein